MPKQAVAFAVLLLAAGFSCLMAGLALGAQGTANATALFVLGALMFTPVRGSSPSRVASRLCNASRRGRTRAPAARLQQSVAPSIMSARVLTALRACFPGCVL